VTVTFRVQLLTLAIYIRIVLRPSGILSRAEAILIEVRSFPQQIDENVQIDINQATKTPF
jgi:hypothetical protein